MSAAPTTGHTTRRSERVARRRGVGVSRLVGGTLAVWLLIGVASVAWWPVYRSPSMLVAGITAVVVGSVIALGGSVTRLPAPFVLLATVVGFVVFGVPVAVPSAADGMLPTPSGVLELSSAVALGWKRLVTISLPVGDYESLLVPYFASALVATVVAVSVATRSRRQELASIPAFVVFAEAIVVGPTALGYPVVSGVVLVGLALVWALTARHVRRAVAVASTVGGRVGFARAILRPALVGTATIAAAGVVATSLGVLAAPQGDREVARSTVVRQFDPRDYVSPLSGFRAYEESDEANRDQLRVSGLPEDGFVRIATLDTYDGVVYSVGGSSGASGSSTFSRVPTSVDVGDVRGDHVDVSVQLLGYHGVWIPTVGDLEQVSFTGADAADERGAFYYNSSTATAAVVGGVGRGTSYRLSAVVPDQPTSGQLAGARPGPAIVPTPTHVPEAVGDTVQAYTKDVSGAGRKLTTMITALRAAGYVSHGVGDERPSRSGHGADRIQELLTAPLMIGDGEQYAVAAALMAERIGFPARVVLGFAGTGSATASSAGTSGSGTGATDDVAADTTTFRGSDITARIEVDTAQYGWVTIDPNPPVREIPAEQQQTPQPVTRPETVVPPPPAADQDRDTQSPPQADRNTPPMTPLWLQILLAALPWAIGTLAFVALVLLPFAVIVAVKRIRRRRRARAPTGRARVVGAWDEYRDVLLDRGVPVGTSATRREVAHVAPGSGGTGLAALADHAVFGPNDTDAHTAERMWSATDAAIAELGTGRTRWERFRSATSTRSLRGRRPAFGGRTTARYDVRRPNEDGGHL
ncbi:transglutaminase-like domain-containing protein [Curtobacterium sp. RRHDQ10]|uniref:transglutaminase-like domain-containing protein n=1 Tax=Curtobacterium phyllosphaerae TaxID=3413379 RepID=UPI003BF37296